MIGATAAPRVQIHWILDRRSDLVFTSARRLDRSRFSGRHPADAEPPDDRLLAAFVVPLVTVGHNIQYQDPSTLGLGEQLFAACIVGFALQHCYLDAPIWRVSRDRDIQQHLRV